MKEKIYHCVVTTILYVFLASAVLNPVVVANHTIVGLSSASITLIIYMIAWNLMNRYLFKRRALKASDIDANDEREVYLVGEASKFSRTIFEAGIAFFAGCIGLFSFFSRNGLFFETIDYGRVAVVGCFAILIIANIAYFLRYRKLFLN